MRPSLHFTSENNWINDPNGLIYYNDEYHIFYQYFPYDTSWGTMHWGHATTKDFIDYTQHKIAIFPSKDADANGIFSGSSIEKDGKMHIFYTGVKYQKENTDNIHLVAKNYEFIATQMKITSTNGYEFNNFENKKIIIPTINDPKIGHYSHTRDPKVWEKSGLYYMIIGTKIKNKIGNYQGKLLIYKSKNLEDFSLFSSYTSSKWGDMWECPDYFELNNQGYLIMSPENMTKYDNDYNSHPIITKAFFDYETGNFKIKQTVDTLDCGHDIYAPQTFINKHGERTLICWIRMPEPVVDGNNCYIGMMTMPRIMKNNKGTIRYELISDISKKFIKTSKYHSEKVMKITALFKEYDYINIGGYDFKYQGSQFHADRTKVFIKNENILKKIVTPKINKCKVHVEIYVDFNVIEIFINHGTYVLTQVVYNLGDSVSTNISDLKFEYLK